jgi:23S rRNA (guanosine2251-2'-O)-methyltransferase
MNMMKNNEERIGTNEDAQIETNNSPDTDLVFGRNPVLEALRRGRPITKLWLLEDTKESVLSEITGRSREAGIPYKFVDKMFLDRLTSNGIHQGMVAQAGAKNYVEWETMLEDAQAKGEVPLLILLDEVEDPYNLGAVLRSADALGAHGVIIPKHRAVPLTASVGRASAGAVEYVPVARVTNLTQTIEKLKKMGLWVMGATASAGQTIYDTDWSVPTALVLGGENKGLSRLVESKCDTLVSIPMTGHVNSLNVSASAAIVLSEITRQRRQHKKLTEKLTDKLT